MEREKERVRSINYLSNGECLILIYYLRYRLYQANQFDTIIDKTKVNLFFSNVLPRQIKSDRFTFANIL